LKNPNANDPVFEIVNTVAAAPSPFNMNHAAEELAQVIFDRALRRFQRGQPPRKHTDNTMGDAINWEGFCIVPKIHDFFVFVFWDSLERSPESAIYASFDNWHKQNLIFFINGIRLVIHRAANTKFQKYSADCLFSVLLGPKISMSPLLKNITLDWFESKRLAIVRALESKQASVNSLLRQLADIEQKIDELKNHTSGISAEK
jgi:hypothetical protein